MGRLPNRAVTAKHSAVLERLKARTVAAGSFSGVCLPALAQHYLERLSELFAVIDRPLGPEEALQFRHSFVNTLKQGFAQSPHARFLLAYRPAESRGVDCALSIFVPSLEEQYRDWLTATAGAEPFGKHPDARVMALAEALQQAGDSRARVLDVGAGDGRNALPLARLGLLVDALEPVSELSAVLREAAAREALSTSVLEQDLLSEELELPSQRYQLIVLSEVLPHLSVQDLKAVLPRLTRALAPGGRLLMNAFVAEKGYTPDALALQAAPSVWSSFLTRSELAALASDSGITLVSDEGCVAYEKARLPLGAWPPTPWYANWASGHNLFAHSAGHAPIELRWLEYRQASDDVLR